MKDKLRILIYKNRVPVGYVKSVSYKNGSFTMTKDKSQAKKYSTQDRVQYDIDVIAFNGLNQGCVFLIDY